MPELKEDFKPLFNVQAIDPTVSTQEIRKFLVEKGRLKTASYSDWMQFSWDEIILLLHEMATYVAPTEELLDYLDELIGEEKTIEICAGAGYIGKELDIMMTDSYQQKYDKLTRQLYQKTNQPTINYPKNVMRLEASEAVRRMKPHTVLGCYATHKWSDETNSGNYKGVDFLDIYDRVKRIVLVGHKQTHGDNPLMKLPHEEVVLPGLLTRAKDRSLNRIFIWEH